jgi:hypothetical protein
VAAGVALIVLGIGSGLGAGWVNHLRTAASIGPAYPRPFICGERLWTGPGAAGTQGGLTVALDAARNSGVNAGPRLTVTITAERAVSVGTSPTEYFEVLYLRDGVIVGGGPLLNESGDLTPQGINLIGAGFAVAPAQPFRADLGPRDRLCAGLTWPDVWSAADRYVAVLVLGPVLPTESPERIRLEITTLGYWPLLVAQAALDG